MVQPASSVGVGPSRWGTTEALRGPVTRPTTLLRTGSPPARVPGSPHPGEGHAGAAFLPFASAYDLPWVWKRPRLWRRRYELLAGHALLGTLESRTALRSAVA